MEARRKSSVGEDYAKRLQSMKNRRKSSANQVALERALEAKVAMVEGKELSEADRKLAEMGYQQVQCVPVYVKLVMLTLSPGLQARVLVDVLHLLCAVYIRSLC